MGADKDSSMLSGPASLSTVTTDELRAQNIHRYLDVCMNEDFVATREGLRLPGLFLDFWRERMCGLLSYTTFS